VVRAALVRRRRAVVALGDFAAVPADVRRVVERLRAADLRGADLRAAVLRAGDLRGADLRAADLRAAGLLAAGLLAVLAVLGVEVVLVSDIFGAQPLSGVALRKSVRMVR
jgi:uncharacterized protein YjbI with pentapeptide repeats